MTSYVKDTVLEPLDVFHIFDSVGDGKIFVSQVGDLMRALGQNPTESIINKLICKFKRDERIDFDVFLPLYNSVAKTVNEYNMEDILEGFCSLDRDGNGVISSSELRYLLTMCGDKLTNKQVDAVLSNVEDVQGLVDYSKLVHEVFGIK